MQHPTPPVRAAYRDAMQSLQTSVTGLQRASADVVDEAERLARTARDSRPGMPAVRPPGTPAVAPAAPAVPVAAPVGPPVRETSLTAKFRALRQP